MLRVDREPEKFLALVDAKDEETGRGKWLRVCPLQPVPVRDVHPQADGAAPLPAALALAGRYAARAEGSHGDAQRPGHVEGSANMEDSVGQSLSTVLGACLGYACGALTGRQAGSHVSRLAGALCLARGRTGLSSPRSGSTRAPRPWAIPTGNFVVDIYTCFNGFFKVHAGVFEPLAYIFIACCASS